MNDSWSRRLVYFDTDIRVEGLEHDENGISLLKNEELRVVPMSEADEFISKYEILGGLRPEPNMLLVLSPYDDHKYISVSDSRNLVAIQKGVLTMRLCKLLGARRVEIMNMKLQENERTIDVDISGKGGPITKGSVSGKYVDIESLRNQLKMEAAFHGGEPSISKAEEMIKDSRLLSDPLLKSLVDMVKDDSESSNRTKDISMNVSLTHSLQSTLDLAAKLKFPTGSAIGANVKTVTKEKIEIYIEIKIEF